MQHASVINIYGVFIKLVELLKRHNISSFKFGFSQLQPCSFYGVNFYPPELRGH